MRIELLIIFLFGVLAPLSGFAAQSVAVLPFSKGAADAQYDGLGTALAGMVVSDLSSVDGLQLVERERLADLLAEMKLSKSGFIDPKTAQKLGRGLGAELVVTGSYSVVKDTFVIDTRLVRVQTGEVVTAARSDGPAAEFVAIEKDVVEKLLVGMQVKLSLSARRKLLIAAPTEDVNAMASYGRGLDSRDAGRLEQARADFEEAVRRDPQFALASSELAVLSARVKALQLQDKTRYEDNKQKAKVAALRVLVDETTRGKRFKDTPQSQMDLAIRLALLYNLGQHCQHYIELKHYLVRTGGQAEWFVNAMPGQDSLQRFNEAGRRMDARGVQLGLVGPGTWQGTRPRELLNASSRYLSGPISMLVGHSLQAPLPRHTLGTVLGRCHEPASQLSEWAELTKLARRLDLLDHPLFVRTSGAQVTLTLRDSMELYLAWVRAGHLGIDAEVSRITEGVLARHPEGDPDRRSVLSAIDRVVVAAESRERRLAARMGLSAATLKAAAVSIASSDGAMIRLDNPICAGVASLSATSVKNALKRQGELTERSPAQRQGQALNQLGQAIGPLAMARCFVSASSDPVTVAQTFALVREGVQRVHPAKVGDERCASSRASLSQSVSDDELKKMESWGADVQARQVFQRLSSLHGLRTSRCLLP